MNKILAGFFILAVVIANVIAADKVNTAIYQSSFTYTNDTLKEIVVSTSAYNPSGTALYLHSVVVSSPSAGGGLILYNSQKKASAQIANIDLGARDTYIFDIWLSSGLTYSTTGNVGGVTMNFSGDPLW